MPALFSVLFLVSAVICFVDPVNTFAGLADMLGFLFLIVGIWWMVRAFLERAVNPLWWLELISGILMTGIAFWTAGQFFVEKAYILLVFAGIWALMEGTGHRARVRGPSAEQGALAPPDRPARPPLRGGPPRFLTDGASTASHASKQKAWLPRRRGSPGYPQPRRSP